MNAEISTATSGSVPHQGAVRVAGGRQKCRLWTHEEDGRLVRAVKTMGTRNWHKIAAIVGHRTADQCCQRWYRALSPDIVKGQWSDAEDALLMQLVGRFGESCWRQIALHISGRTDIQCRSRWVKKDRKLRKMASSSAASSSTSTSIPGETTLPLISAPPNPSPVATTDPSSESESDADRIHRLMDIRRLLN